MIDLSNKLYAYNSDIDSFTESISSICKKAYDYFSANNI